MEQGLAKVVTLDSDSEDDLEILSESIPNYGNYSTPVEIAPELQMKIRLSLEKRVSLPVKIKTIKVYSTKRSGQVMGSVRASFRLPGGQPFKTINVGASINDLFSSQVRGGANNNLKKPEIATASDSAKQVQTVQIGSRQPLPVGADQRVTERPSTPSSPVILYSPIRKRKPAKSTYTLDRALPTLRFQQTVTHPPQNLTPPLDPWKKNVSQCLDGENDSQESSKTEMKTSEDFKVKKNIPKVKYEGESRLYNETETDVYIEEQCSNFGSEKQNSNDNFLMSKYVKINVETLPKNLLGSSTIRSENESCLKVKSDKDVSGPPLWSTIFPPTPPSPPPASLWELDAGGFEAITGLSSHQTANDFKKKINLPKPRVLRKRRKN